MRTGAYCTVIPPRAWLPGPPSPRRSLQRKLYSGLDRYTLAADAAALRLGAARSAHRQPGSLTPLSTRLPTRDRKRGPVGTRWPMVRPQRSTTCRGPDLPETWWCAPSSEERSAPGTPEPLSPSMTDCSTYTGTCRRHRRRPCRQRGVAATDETSPDVSPPCGGPVEGLLARRTDRRQHGEPRPASRGPRCPAGKLSSAISPTRTA